MASYLFISLQFRFPTTESILSVSVLALPTTNPQHSFLPSFLALVRRPRGVSVRERVHPRSSSSSCLFYPCVYRFVEGTKRTRFTLARTLLREWLKDSLPDPSSFPLPLFFFFFFLSFLLSFHVTPRRRSNVNGNHRFFTLRRINLLHFRATRSCSRNISLHFSFFFSLPSFPGCSIRGTTLVRSPNVCSTRHRCCREIRRPTSAITRHYEER